MKIAVPVMDLNHNKFQIANSLSVLGYLCIFDMVKNELRWKQTIDYAPSMGELLPALEQQDVSIIIVKNILPMALQVLTHKGFQVFKAKGDNLEANISYSINGALEIYEYEQALSNTKTCGNSCDSCYLECN
jgi:predicted Fe-Mo cluster-binding NifX family protein